jgi:hypothetical protein
MADPDAIRQQTEHARETERLVVAGLAEYLEEAVRLLPEHSRLCAPCLISADKFRGMAGWPDPGSTAGLALLNMQKELRRMGIGEND